MRRIAVATALLTTIALSAESHAACATVSDPAGDVEAAPGVAIPDSHLDLRTIAVRPTTSTVVVTFRDAALSDIRKGTWRLTFKSRRATLFVSAGLGAWANVGEVATPSGFRAGIVGNASRDVTGGFDYRTSTITVTVPYAAFGGRLTRRDSVISDVVVTAEEILVNAGVGGTAQQVSWRDAARASRLLLTRC